jgi:hypothetical protein
MLNTVELAAYQSSGSLIIDDRRRRPLWFDGRFLAAKDLEREQNYFLTRQSDLRRAAGFGVISGLNVKQVTTLPSGVTVADTISIGQGEGVTPEGELVTIPQDVEIALSDIASEQPLNAAFGLSEIPTSPMRSRSGLFVLALRAVEFSANPIASYPVTVSGRRSTQDGDTVEAAAVVLIPYPDSGTSSEMDVRRSLAAREIFVTQSTKSSASDVLPLAMIGMDHGFVSWVDPWMVRREVGSDQILLSLNASARATRRAYLLQYENQLQQVILQRQQAQQGASFAATDYFDALPAIGRMPAACIDPTQYTQNFFPQDIDVVLSIIPSDELPGLIEDSLSLPPLDLMQPSATLATLGVYVLMPLTRAVYAQHVALGTQQVVPSVPADPSRRLPLDTLQLNKALSSATAPALIRLGNRILLPPVGVAAPQTGGTSNTGWAAIFQNQTFAWFVRRRSAPQAITLTQATGS